MEELQTLITFKGPRNETGSDQLILSKLQTRLTVYGLVYVFEVADAFLTVYGLVYVVELVCAWREEAKKEFRGIRVSQEMAFKN